MVNIRTSVRIPSDEPEYCHHLDRNANVKQPKTILSEWCEPCGGETDHDVSLRIVTESKKPVNAQFSREPYRITTCLTCGANESTRMNNR
ncbi:DUF7835 family putative zinc beta-ribbon protein [Halogranum rubrum]